MHARIDDMFAMSQKVELTRATFLTRILPTLVCFYLMAVLVQLKGTCIYRLALFPVILCLSYRAVFVDMSGGDPTKAQSNSLYITQMCAMIPMRSTAWAFTREPYRRLNAANKHVNIYTALWNAWGLFFTARGIGWNWSPSHTVPKPAFQTNSRIAFVLWSAILSAFHALCLGVCHLSIHVLSPNTFGSFDGGTLFDRTLPPLLERARALFVGIMAMTGGYLGIQMIYQLLAIVGVIVFHQTPAQWPPIFNYFWLSTSLADFWGRRWHQMVRHVVTTLGVEPFGRLFGRAGGLLGGFLVSGVLHDIEFRALGRSGNMAAIYMFWLMNGVGIVLERAWKKVTGRRVDGFGGWVWTFGWLALWGVPMVDEWAKAGRFGGRGLANLFPHLVGSQSA